MRPPLLDQAQIERGLAQHPMWRLEESSLPPQRIVRDVVAPNFLAAVGLINAIALAAEKLDHHPDILLYGWNKLRITSTTHDQGGITELDFKLAEAIDAIVGT
ncbi:MAG: 4a-hydroxytetrahydrobiopterin dehydratase [Bacteroidota bacterium]|nr:4a-hydroxytetrahydrobiopterin dehydratase [Candidatus Kapabacteria bacterium]MDW8075735.1 4a-hydroxytetrahydrobiopterin dehydratase [Bacteroidota bacterium]MDW8272481.1 4a-hydroxytetrahydrobiopterin dehydratase [Bacteroidota bacterium]